MIYLDNAATTPLLDDIKDYLTKDYYNPSSNHKVGEQSKMALEGARERIARTLHAQPNEIIFTSGGTEANNLIINGVAKKYKKGKIITTKIEHPSVLKTCKHLERKGFDVVYIPVGKDGTINFGELKREITYDTILVSVMMVNNEIGTLQNIKEIGHLCKRMDVIFHTDAVQAYGHMNIDVVNYRLSALSASGHKFGAPKGVGFLYLRNKVKIKPLIYGGGQERRLRSGTENVNGIVAMSKAAVIQRRYMRENLARREEMHDYLIDELGQIDGVRINGSLGFNIHSHVNITVEGVDAEALATLLSENEIYVSTGSACSSKNGEPSHVLLAIGLSKDEANSSIRVSLNENNTLGEIKEFVSCLKQSIKFLRRQ